MKTTLNFDLPEEKKELNMKNKLKAASVLKILSIVKSCETLDQLIVIDSFVKYKINCALHIDDYFFIMQTIAFKNGDLARQIKK